ncbi:3'-5' exonuclease [Paradevosia shaoguanensis]|uniref:Transcriptional regulator n=1 Tax=Paradevosia shaoguanensis TaxID=1335043 RepID=A0AA41QLY0_9HYPH|nr:transcriptional regulator [Paradevosia shaoguanensis]MCF1742822.1 transcriptional regulator [Paradevosia shaoguanensis]MCI0127305.1 transcriptional regulator [Paradevosia shaoguanensis]
MPPIPVDGGGIVVLIFIDFEASSLSKQSYPIEIGWVTEAGAEEGHLIRPAPIWTEWDARAELIHGLSRAQLSEEGEPHDLVCERVISVFGGNDIYASAPSWDGHWLSMLLRASGKPRHLLRLSGTSELFLAAARGRLGTTDDALAAAHIEQVRQSLKQPAQEHRAVSDARREWELWKALVA